MVLLKALVEALFRLLFTYDAVGEENIPSTGPAVVASNHPSYLDPILLSLQVKRPIRFMAWDALFRVPLLGSLIRAFGAFPVDVRPGRGAAAYARAKELVTNGEVVGVFPEGKRSRAGWMEAKLREGAARLALETGAPLVPATITGAFRAWPHFRLLPRATKIRVRFHEAIDPAAYAAVEVDARMDRVLDELRRRVERTLLPGVKADLRIESLYRTPAPFPRLFEWLPAMAAALFVFWRTRSWLTVAPAYAYVAYLLLDAYALPQVRFTKRLRNASAAVFALAFAPIVLDALGRPRPVAPLSLLALLAGASLAYVYERGFVALAFVLGLEVAVALGLFAQCVWPSPVGAHVALPIFAAAFAYARRTVFWRFAVPLLVVYAVSAWVTLSGGPQPWPHAAAGLLAWVSTQLVPSKRFTPRDQGLATLLREP